MVLGKKLHTNLHANNVIERVFSMQQSEKAMPVHIVIYRITGKQLFFRIPEKVCEECDLSVAIVYRVIKELGAEGKIKVTVNIAIKK